LSQARLVIEVRRGGGLKNAEEVMEILEAYDLTGTLRGAAALVGCDHKTVARLVRREEAGGGLPVAVRPRPRVDSALMRLRRVAPAPAAGVVRLVRDAFAHRRKPLASSLELAGGPSRQEVRAALERLELEPDVRAERLAPATRRDLSPPAGDALAGALQLARSAAASMVA